jgi:hypothetical protein
MKLTNSKISEQFAAFIDLTDENLEEINIPEAGRIQGAGWSCGSCGGWSCGYFSVSASSFAGGCSCGSCGSCESCGSCGSCGGWSCSCGSCSCGSCGGWGFSCGSCDDFWG